MMTLIAPISVAGLRMISLATVMRVTWSWLASERPRERRSPEEFSERTRAGALEFTEEIQADVFEHARADELDEIGIEVARDATQEKHGRDPQHDAGELPPGKDVGAPGENHGNTRSIIRGRPAPDATPAMMPQRMATMSRPR